MKDQINKTKTIAIWGQGSSISDKLALLTDKNSVKTYTPGYVVGFIHPVSNQCIFLANCADIADICYCEDPKLPGTTNVKYAKVYPDIETAKSDIYLLRYHHRQFLTIRTIAKPVMHFQSKLALDSMIPEIEHTLYSLDELSLDTDSDPLNP